MFRRDNKLYGKLLYAVHYLNAIPSRGQQRTRNLSSCPCEVEKLRKGPSINDVTQMFWVFWTLPPLSPHFGQISSTKITQPPLLRHILDNPLPPLMRDVIYGCSLRVMFCTLMYTCIDCGSNSSADSSFLWWIRRPSVGTVS